MVNIITRKADNAILAVDALLKYWDNGYPVIGKSEIAYVLDEVNVYESVDIEISEEQCSMKYCYTPESGVYKNEQYIEPNPYGVPADVLNTIIDDYTLDLIEQGVL